MSVASERERLFAAIKKVDQRLRFGRGPRGGTRFQHIGCDAKALGVNRRTLHRALTGEWHLPGLRRRYYQLKKLNA